MHTFELHHSCLAILFEENWWGHMKDRGKKLSWIINTRSRGSGCNTSEDKIQIAHRFIDQHANQAIYANKIR